MIFTVTMKEGEARDLFNFLHDYKLENLGDDPFEPNSVDHLYNSLDSILFPPRK